MPWPGLNPNMSEFSYHRRPTLEVRVGNTAIGGNNPVRIQSMASTSTMDTEASVAQARRIVDAGAELVRFTAQGVREAANLGEIRRRLRESGCDVPLVADIHFNPRAAFAAAEQVEKVRINPGNFVDPGRTFRKIEYTDEEYAAELRRLEEALVPFLETCRANDTAIRLGVNHGSLSDRIMSRYGDTPAGMVESAMEFLRVCRNHGFDRVVISIKASNVVVMVETVTRLVEAMDAEEMHYPLHLGVTEAGDGEDGRIKSAVGIGALLREGIGDTIRVSLSEEPEAELPVARKIMDYIDLMATAAPIEAPRDGRFRLGKGMRRMSREIGAVGGSRVPVVPAVDGLTGLKEIDAETVIAGKIDIAPDDIILLSASGEVPGMTMEAAMNILVAEGIDNPVILRGVYNGLDADTVRLRASIDLGALLLKGFADGIEIVSDALTPYEASRLALAILQSARLRISHTEYIACPGCGRTLFDLQQTLARVKEATSHLKGLKIGVMGCIVNGPGEMADADYGYVGAGVGKISLYKGKECVEKNIPAEEAVSHLVELIKKCGDWKEM